VSDRPMTAIEATFAAIRDAARLEGYMQGLRVAKLAALAETKEYVSGYIRYQQFIDAIEGYEREVRRAKPKEVDQ
jgi:hypothetical protein